MALIDFSTQMLDPLTGEAYPKLDQDNKPTDQPLTMALVSFTALNAQLPGDQNLASGKRYDMGKLIQKILKAEEPVELKAEEISLLKTRIDLAYTPAIVVQAWDILEGKTAAA